MKQRLVVLLKGVNLGAARQLAMPDLQRVLQDLGGEDVQTYLRTGNALLTGEGSPAEWERRVPEALRDATGLDAAVVVRTPRELQQVLDDDPWPEADRRHRHLGVLTRQVPAAAWEALDLAAFAPDQAALRGHAVHLLLLGGMARTKLPAHLTPRRLGGAELTVRTWGTVTALVARAG